MRRMVLSPMNITHLCGSLTDRKNRGKLCDNHGCGISKHSKNHTGALLTMHTYLALPGSSILHPFPIFRYRGLSLDTIKELKSNSLTYNESSNARYLCNITADDKL